MKWIAAILVVLIAPALTAQAEMDVSRGGNVVADNSVEAVSNTGASPFNLTYTIENTGSSNLMLTGMPEVVISGEDNCNVSVISAPGTTTIAGGSSTTFTLQVAPIAATDFSFEVSIANDDLDENPYNWTFDGATANASSSGGGGGSGGDDCSTGETGGTSMLLWAALLAVALFAARRFQQTPHAE